MGSIKCQVKSAKYSRKGKQSNENYCKKAPKKYSKYPK